MKSSQNTRNYGDIEAIWRLVCMGVLFFYCINPMVAQAVPPADHESILYALRVAGLTSFANALDAAIINGGFLVPPSATIFVPTNSAIDALLPSSPNLINLFSYHIITENFPFDVLKSLPIGTQIPTLLPNNTLLVTDNNPSKFCINDEELMAADLCTIQTVACYALNAVLNSTTWGQAVVLATPPVLAPAGSPLLPPVVPPTGSPLIPPQAPLPGSPLPLPVGPSPNSPPPPSSGAPAPASPDGAASPPGTNPPESSSSAAPATENHYKHVMTVVVALIVTIIFV